LTPTLKYVSEEIVRWAFEVSLNAGSKWNIAFTNPTAGPWKRVMAADSNGVVGEVHRFEIDEKRPDLIIYSDTYQIVVIIEAKTDLKGLADAKQIEKTSALYKNLEKLMRSKSGNSHWGKRSKYQYVLGLLWGKIEESEADINVMVRDYLAALNGKAIDVLCIQGELQSNNLAHKVFWGHSKKITTLENYQS
jgi:hypothetical protein